MKRRFVALAAAMLALASVVSANAAKTGLPEPVIPDCFGVQIHFTGDEDKQVKQIADAGFKFIRMDLFWVLVEREKGKYDFSQYDALLNALDRHGIRALLELDFGNPIYSGDSNDKIAPADDASRRAFAAFARAAASRYKNRGVLWEIWNEPNIGFWQPSPNPEHYTLLARAAAKAIHEVDPWATVLGSGLSGLEPNFTREICKRGLLEDIDVYSTHPYRSPDRSPETALPEYPAFSAIVNEYAPKGKTVPVISSEWGYSMTDMSAEKQAQYLVRQFLVNLMSGIRLSIWYDWHDDGTDPNWNECHFGTVTYDFKPKPAYFAAQTLLVKQLYGYRFVRRVKTEKSDDVILVLTNGKNYKLAAWTTQNAHEVSLPVAGVPAVTVADMYGNRKKSDIADGKLRLNLSQSVCYVDSPHNGNALDIK